MNKNIRSHNWHLPSSSGMECLYGSFIGTSEDIIVASVELSGLFWNRFKVNREFDPNSLRDDYIVGIPQLLMSKSAVNRLISELHKWTCYRQDISIDLACIPQNDQIFMIEIGKRSDVICSTDKLACCIIYECGEFRRSKFIYVVDQSCIAIFLEEFKTSLLGLI